MNTAISLWGEKIGKKIKANDIEKKAEVYELYKILGLICPFCRYPVFFRKGHPRQGNDIAPLFAHFPDFPEYCKYRTSSWSQNSSDKNGVPKGQSIDKFKDAFSDIIKKHNFDFEKRVKEVKLLNSEDITSIAKYSRHNCKKEEYFNTLSTKIEFVINFLCTPFAFDFLTDLIYYSIYKCNEELCSISLNLWIESDSLDNLKYQVIRKLLKIIELTFDTKVDEEKNKLAVEGSRVTPESTVPTKLVDDQGIADPSKYFYVCSFPDGKSIIKDGLNLLSTAKGYILDNPFQLMSEGSRFCGTVPLDLEQIAQIQQQLNKKPEARKFSVKVDPKIPIPQRVTLKNDDGTVKGSYQPKKILISNKERLEALEKADAKKPKEKKAPSEHLEVNRILAGSGLASNRKLRSFSGSQKTILEELSGYNWLSSKEIAVIEKALKLNFTEKPLQDSVKVDVSSPIKFLKFVFKLLPYQPLKKESETDNRSTLERKIDAMLETLDPTVEDWIKQHPLRLLAYSMTEYVNVILNADNALSDEAVSNLEGLADYEDQQILVGQVYSKSLIKKDESIEDEKDLENVNRELIETPIPGIKKVNLKPLISQLLRVLELSTRNFNPSLTYQDFRGGLIHSASSALNTRYNASQARLKYNSDLAGRLIERTSQDNKRRSSYLKNSNTRGVESIGILSNLPDFLWVRVPRSRENEKSGFYMGVFPRLPVKEVTLRIPALKKANRVEIDQFDSQEQREEKIKQALDSVNLKADKFKKDVKEYINILYLLESVKFDKLSKTGIAKISKNGSTITVGLNSEVCRGEGFTKIDTLPDPDDLNRRIELSIGRFEASNILADIRVSDTPWNRSSWITVAQIDTQTTERKHKVTKAIRPDELQSIHCNMTKKHLSNIQSNELDMSCLTVALAKLGMQPRSAICPSTYRRHKEDLQCLNWNQPTVQKALGIELQRDSDHNKPYTLKSRIGVCKRNIDYTLKLSYVSLQ